MEAQPEETLPTLKDHLAIQETMHVSNAVNKDISLVIVRKGNDAITTMPTSSILTTMTKNTMTTTPRNNLSTLLTTSKLDLLTSLVMIKPN